MRRAGLSLRPRNTPNQAIGFMYARQAAPTAATAYTIAGPVTGKSLGFRLWLPRTYNPKSDQRYPTIYGFHGKSMSAAQFSSAVTPLLDAAITAGRIEPSIFVMPDFGNFWYCDSFNWATPRETQLIWELIPHIDAHTRSHGDEKRTVTGFSMGCWGAFHIALKYPQLFRGVCGYGGPNLDADSNNAWGGSDNAEFVSVFNSSTAALRLESPCSTTGGTGLAERYQAVIQQRGTGVRLVKSAGDTVSEASCDTLDAQLTALGITHTFVDLTTPTHNVSQYYTADNGDGFAFLQEAIAA